MVDQHALEVAVTHALRGAGACFAFVHGSRATPQAARRPESDLDVAAWWGREVPRPWGMVGVEIDAALDLLVLDDAPLELAGRVALHGRLLFDDDAAARVRWQATTRKRYLDEQLRQVRLHRVFVAARLARVTDGR